MIGAGTNGIVDLLLGRQRPWGTRQWHPDAVVSANPRPVRVAEGAARGMSLRP
ncbi:MAG TPA: hypothetical protein VLK88_11235 [Gemmatimonadales bacterium]|nr:hypothetical protein [Gemmatimonadales bacterium]